MSLRVALAEKFPEAPESEILKVTWILFIEMKKLNISVLSCEKNGDGNCLFSGYR